MSKSTIGWRKAGISSLATAALVAGACVAGAGAANATTNFAFKRVQGPDRYGTSAAVAAHFGHANDVIVASGMPGHYPDALAANYLAGIKKSPVLLTKKNTTPTAVDQAIKDSGASDVWIIGGTDVISAAQEDALSQEGYTVHRLAGENRFLTDAKVINQGGQSSGEGIVATGLNFPDALGAGPLAYAKDMPLAISKTNDISDTVVKALQDAGVTKVLIAGGTDVVSNKVVAKLAAAGITVDQRFAGSDRSDTAAQIASYELNHGFTNKSVNVASGAQLLDGADALGGGALSGQNMTPMLITKNVNHPGTATDAYLTKNANTLADGFVFGGPQAISDNAVSEMENAAQSVTTNQSYSVNPQSAQTVTVSSGSPSDNAGVVKYTVTGLTDGTPVDIQLADPANVTTGANGQTTFKADSSNNAVFGSPAGTITVVNGIPNGTGSQKADGVMPVNGQVSFSVDSSNPGTAQPVVYSRADTNDTLELDANGAPKEDFGVGGAITWTAAPAGSGTYNGATGNPSNLTVTSVNPANNTFQATYTDATGNNQAGTFSYGSAGSTYTYVNGLPMSESQFAADLGKNDVLSVAYNANGPSNWTYQTDVPAAPTSVAATYDASANSGAGDVVITWKDVPNGDVTGYKVTRYTVTNGKVDASSATDVAGAWNTSASASKATDSPAPAPGTYEYTVTAKAASGNGPESDYSGSVTVPKAADSTAPTVANTNGIVTSDNNKDGVIDNGDQVAVNFSEPVTLGSSASFTFRDADGSVGTLTRGGNATMSLNGSGTTAFINVTGAPVPQQAGGALGLDSTASNETVTNSTGVTDTAGNDLAEVKATPDTSTAGNTFTVTFNSPIDTTTVTNSDFVTPSSNSVTGVAWNSTDTVATVTVTNAITSGDTGYGIKAQSVQNTDGGNGPATKQVS